MTDQQSTAIRAVLAAAPASALRRVIDQPEGRWKMGYLSKCGCRCLLDTMEDARIEPRWPFIAREHPSFLTRREQIDCIAAFDAACAADGLRETVRRVKGWAREEMERRG